METRVSAASVAPPLIPAPKTFLKRLSSLRLSSSRSSYKLTHSPPHPPATPSPLPPPVSTPPAVFPLPPPAVSILSPLAASPLSPPAASPLPSPPAPSLSPPANHARAPPATLPAATHPNTPPATPPHIPPAAPPLPLPAAHPLTPLPPLASPPPAALPLPPLASPPPAAPPLPPPDAPPLPPPPAPPLPPHFHIPHSPPSNNPPPSKLPRDPKGEDNRTYSTSTSEVMGYLDAAIGDHHFSTSSVDEALDYRDFSLTVKFDPPPNSTPSSSNPPTTTTGDSWTANGTDVEDVFHSDQAHFASEHNPDTYLSLGDLLTNAGTENIQIDDPEKALFRNSHNDYSEENNNKLVDTETRNLSPSSKNQGRRKSSGSPLKVTVSKLKPDIKTVRQQIRPGSVGELTHMFTNLMEEQVLSPSVGDYFQFDVGEMVQSHDVGEMTQSHGLREMTQSPDALPSDPSESPWSPSQSRSPDSVPHETSPQFQSSGTNPSSNSMYQHLITHPLKQAQDLTHPLEQPQNITHPLNQPQNITHPLNQSQNITHPLNQPQNITHPLNQPQNIIHQLKQHQNITPPLNQPQNITHPLKQSRLKSTSLPVLDATPGLDYLAASREMFQLVLSSINKSQTNLAHSDSKLHAVPGHAHASENKPPSLIATSRGSNTSSLASLVKRGSRLHSEKADKTEYEMADKTEYEMADKTEYEIVDNYTREGHDRSISTTDRGGTLDGRDVGLLIASTPSKDDSQHTAPTVARTPVGRNVAELQYLNKDEHKSLRQPGQEREFSLDVSRYPVNVEESVTRFASYTAATTQSPPGHDNNTTHYVGGRLIDKGEITGSNGEWTSLHSRTQVAGHAEPLHILSKSENKNRSTQFNERRHSSHISGEDAPLDTPQTAHISPQLSFTANRGLGNSQLCVSSSQGSDLPADNNFQGTEYKTSSSRHDNQIQLNDHPRDYVVMSDGRADGRTSFNVAEDYSSFFEEKGFVKNAVAKYSSQVIGHSKDLANGAAVNCVDEDSLANSGGGGRSEHSVNRKEIGFESPVALGHLKDEALLLAANETSAEKSIAGDKQAHKERDLRDVVVTKSQRGKQSTDVHRLPGDEDGDDVLNSIDQSDAASEASISSEFQAAVALLYTEDTTDSGPGQGEHLDRPSAIEQQHDDFRTLLDDIQIETDITSGFLRSSRRSGRKQRLKGSNSDPEHTRVSSPGHSVVPGLKGSTLGTTLDKTTTKGQTTTTHIGVTQSVDLSEDIRQQYKGVDLSEEIRKQHKDVSPTRSEPAEEKPLHADSRAASSPTSLHINGADNSSLTKETHFDSHFFIQPENMAASNHQLPPSQDLIVAAETSRSIPWSDYELKSQLQFTAAPPEMETERSVNFSALRSSPKTATKEIPNKIRDQQNRHAAPGNERNIQTTASERGEQQQLSSQESSIVATLVSRSVPWAMYEERLSPSKEGPILSEEFVGKTVHEGARRNSSVGGNHLEANNASQYYNEEETNLKITPGASFVDSYNEEKSMAEQKEDNSHLFSKEKFQDMRRVFEKQDLENHFQPTPSSQVEKNSLKSSTSPSSLVGVSKSEDYGEVSIHEGRNVTSRLETGEDTSRDAHHGCVDLKGWPNRHTEIATAEDGECRDSSSDSASGSDVDTSRGKRPRRRKSKQTNFSYDLQTGQLQQRSVSSSSSIGSSHSVQGDIIKTARVNSVGSSNGNSWLGAEEFVNSQGKHHPSPFITNRCVIVDDDLRDFGETSTYPSKSAVTHDEDIRKHINSGESLQSGVQTRPLGASLSEVEINRSEDGDRPRSFVEDKATAHAQKHSDSRAGSNSQSSGKSRSSDSGFNVEDIISLEPGKERSQRFDTGVHRQISDVDVQGGLRGRRPSTDSHKQDQLIDAFLRSGARPTVPESSRQALVQEDTAWVSNSNDSLDQKGFQKVQQPTSSEKQDESTPSELVTSSTKIDKHLFRNTDSENLGPSFWRSTSSDSNNSSNDNMTAVVGELSSFSIHKKANSLDESFKAEHGDLRVSASSRGTAQVGHDPRISASSRGAAPAGHDQSVDSDIYLVQDTKGDYYALQEVDDTRSSVGKVNLHVFDAPPEEQRYGAQNGHTAYDERVLHNYNDIHAVNTDLYVDSSAVEEDKAREVISAYLNMQEISGRPESVVSNGTSHALHKPAQHSYPQRNRVVVQQQGYEGMTNDTSVQTDDETSPDSLRHAPSYPHDGRAHRPPGTGYPGSESGYNDFRAGQDRHTSSLRLTDLHPDPAKVTQRPNDSSTGQAYHPTDSTNHSRHHTVVSPFLISPIAITTTTQAVVGEQVGMHIDYSTADASTSDEDSSQRLYVVKNLPHKSSLKKSSKYDSSSLSDSGSDIVFTKGGSPGARISRNNTSDNILRSYNSSHRQQRYASRSDSLSPRAVVDGPMYSTYQSPRSHPITSISPRDDRTFHNHSRHEKFFTSSRQPEENSLYRVRNLSASMPDGLHHAGTRRKVSRNSSSHLNDAATLDRSPRKHHSPERFFKNPQLSLRKGDNEASRHSSGEDNQYRSVTKVYLSDNELKSAPRSSQTLNNESYSHRTSDEATITRTQSVQPSRLNNDPPSTKTHRTVIQLDVDGTTARDPQNQLNYGAGGRQTTTTGRPRHSDRHGIRSSGDDSDSDPGRPDARDSRLVKTLKQKDGNKLYVVSSTVSDPQASNGHMAHSPGWYKSTIDINMNSLEKLQPVLSDLLDQERADSSSYRTEKTVLFVKETSPQTNVGRSVQRTHSTDFVYPDSGQGTEIASSDGEHELRHKTERVERIYEMRSEPELPEHLSSMEDLNNDLRVLRGNILIKNRMTGEHDLDDFDENVNLFDNSFHLGKDNPLFSSDQDLQASLRNEEERDLAQHITQDITFESVDKIAHQFSSEKQVQVKSAPQRKKQNLSQLLLSKLANVDSKDIRQTIDVEHHNEEIYGDIDFIHADGQRKGSKNTRNFDSVNENVELTLTQGKAYVIIKVIAERIIPTDYEFNVWRKSQAIVTREIEIDLLANDQRRRLYKHVMSSAGVAGSLQYNSRDQDSEQLSPQERQLSSIETLKLFSQILDVTDGQGDKDVTETRTRQEMGQLPASAMDLLY